MQLKQLKLMSKIVNNYKIFLHLQKIWYNVVRVGEL